MMTKETKNMEKIKERKIVRGNPDIQDARRKTDREKKAVWADFWALPML